MKKLVLLIVLIIVVQCQNQSFGQDNKARIGKIGINYSSFGINNIVHSSNTDLLGAPSYNGDNFQTLGINYIHTLNKWLELETGLEFSKHSIQIKPNLPPDMDNTPYKEKLKLINIPLTLRANFLKFFFVNAGVILEFDTYSSSPIDSQSGIGSIFGIAAKYDFSSGISLFVNHYFKSHTLIPFGTAQGDYRQRLFEEGIRIGITYQFNKKIK